MSKYKQKERQQFDADAPINLGKRPGCASLLTPRGVADQREIFRATRKKKSAQADELRVHTLDVKPPISEYDQNAQNMRSRCLQVGKSLEQRGNIRKALYKAGKKIQNCRVYGLFREVSDTVYYKEGAALCKQRLCPNCQRVLSAKRKENTLRWFELNRTQLRKFFFYHMVLTVPHSEAEGVRTGRYMSDLLQCFARLRGTAKGMSGWERKENKAWWSEWIAGGFYYVEDKPARHDKTAHTHLHCIVLANKQLWNAKQDSKFLQEAGPRWAYLTGNTSEKMKGVFVDPVYYIEPETKERVNCHFGSSVNLQGAVSEAVKYTMKTDTETLNQFSDEYIEDMLTAKNRYYGRFGCLTPKDESSQQFKQLDMLCTDFVDVDEKMAVEAARLFNPETGEIVVAESTRLLVTPMRNMRATEKPGWVEGTMADTKTRQKGEKIVLGEMVFQFDGRAGTTHYFQSWEKAAAVARMGARSANEYDATIELDNVEANPARRAAQRKAAAKSNPKEKGSVSWGPRTAAYLAEDKAKARKQRKSTSKL